MIYFISPTLQRFANLKEIISRTSITDTEYGATMSYEVKMDMKKWFYILSTP